jgi:hypothetical protein
VSEAWCTVPFGRIPKTPFDKLVDILLQLPSCLPCRNEMRKAQYSHPSKSQALRIGLATTAKRLNRRLDELWQEHMNEVDPNYDQRLQVISSHLVDNKDDNRSIPCTHYKKFKSSSDAYLISMYEAGKLITLGFLEAASLVLNSYKKGIIMHGASILTSAAYCETQGLLNGVSFSMVFPIKLVCLLSPSEQQRIRARNVLLKWGIEKGLADVCDVSAPSYFDHSHG